MFSFATLFFLVAFTEQQQIQNETQLINLLSEKQYKGEWYGGTENNTCLMLRDGEGTGELRIENQTIFFNIINTTQQEIPIISGRILLTNFSLLQKNWQASGILYLQGIDEDQKIIVNETCRINYKVSVVINNRNLFFNQRKQIKIMVQTHDSDQRLTSLALQVSEQNSSSQANLIVFSLFFSLLTILSVFKLCKVMDQFRDAVTINNGSLLSIFISTNQDGLLYCFYWNEFSKIEDSNCFYFLPLALLQICHYGVSCGLAWKIFSVKFDINQNCCYQITFVFTFVLSYNINYSAYLFEYFPTYYMYQFALPLLFQVIHNARIKSKGIFEANYLILLSIKSIFALYINGYPRNVFEEETNYIFCLIYIAITTSLLILLYYQKKLGPLFFFCQYQRPLGYRYKKKIQISDEEGGCSICLGSLLVKQNEDIEQINNVNRTLLVQVMETPCHHKFHVYCLTQWMEVQQVCPLCRTALS